MTSMIARYAALEAERKRLDEQMQALESDSRMKAELDFKGKLEKLMKDFDKSAGEVVALLSPEPAHGKTAASGRRKRRLKIYKNPQTGEVIETRGGNNKALRNWKDEYGEETVESWLVRVED